MKDLPDGWTITVRLDRISPWFDVGFEGEHFASFKNQREAWDYALGVEADVVADLWPCGCTDYHLADCPVVTKED